jgi:hypothetical protein
VRQSILIVEFVKLEVAKGKPVHEAAVAGAEIRMRPILITSLTLMAGAWAIIQDPIFQGMAVSLLFGAGVATLMAVIVIPLGCISMRKQFYLIETETGEIALSDRYGEIEGDNGNGGDHHGGGARGRTGPPGTSAGSPAAASSPGESTASRSATRAPTEPGRGRRPVWLMAWQGIVTTLSALAGPAAHLRNGLRGLLRRRRRGGAASARSASVDSAPAPDTAAAGKPVAARPGTASFAPRARGGAGAAAVRRAPDAHPADGSATADAPPARPPAQPRTSKKTAAKGTAVKKAPARKTAAKKTAAKKTVAKKAAAKKAPAKKTAPTSPSTKTTEAARSAPKAKPAKRTTSTASRATRPSSKAPSDRSALPPSGADSPD